MIRFSTRTSALLASPPRLALALLTMATAFAASVAAAPTAAVRAAPADAPAAPPAPAGGFTLPLLFEENRGQSDAEFRFVARAGALRLALAADRVVLAPAHAAAPPVAFVLEGACRAAPLIGESPQATTVRYHLDRARGAATGAAATFAQLRTVAPWPGIDVVWHASGTQLEYDFVVASGADATAIALRFEGVTGASLAADGALRLETPFGALVQPAPATWEIGSDGLRQPVAARWQLLPAAADGAVRATFALGVRDGQRTLVIDPVVGFLTLLGGSGFGDRATAIHVAADHLLMVGVADGASFPRGQGGAYQPSAGERDVFFARFDVSGQTLEQLTYFGGSGDDRPNELVVAPDGEIYIAGSTDSPDLPVTPGPGADFMLQASYGGGLGDAFLARFTPDYELNGATYLGGSDRDSATALAWLADGALAVAGNTDSSDFPLSSADEPELTGFGAGFLARVDPRLEALDFSTYVNHWEAVDLHALCATSDGALVVAGESTPVATDRQTIFLRRFDGAGASVSSLLFANSTGPGGQAAVAMCELADGRLALTGDTRSDDFPGAVPPAGLRDAFVAIVDPFLLGIDFAARVGGSEDDAGHVIATRGDRLWIGGSSLRPDLPYVEPLYSGSIESNDLGFVAEWDLAGGAPQLVFCTLVPVVEGCSVRALRAEPQADGPLWVAGSIRKRGPLSALRATGPIRYVASGEDHEPFMLRLDYGASPPPPEYGHVLVTDSITLNPNFTSYEFFAERRGDTSSSQYLTWEMRDAATEELLDTYEFLFPPGSTLTTSTAQLANVTGDVEIRIFAEEGGVTFLPGKEVLYLAVTNPGGGPDGDGDGSGEGGGSSGGGGPHSSHRAIPGSCSCVQIVGALPGGGRGLDALRGLRDRVLARFDAGRHFTRAYYDWSARAVPWLDAHPFVLALLRVTVGPLIVLLGMPWLAALLLAAWWGRGALRRGLRCAVRQLELARTSLSSRPTATRAAPR